LTGVTSASAAPPARRRRISRRRADWARDADRIMLEHGAVFGSVYAKRDQARWKARDLIALMVDLDLHPRSELREHTDRRDPGWVWAVEWIPPVRNR
jgi:alkanesulfonate monooxygenase SsuD/methylene tetrahydromethanopterin reductase-like flavin-dependent oxidoreductase (luciferase family)